MTDEQYRGLKFWMQAIGSSIIIWLILIWAKQ